MRALVVVSSIFSVVDVFRSPQFYLVDVDIGGFTRGV